MDIRRVEFFAGTYYPLRSNQIVVPKYPRDLLASLTSRGFVASITYRSISWVADNKYHDRMANKCTNIEPLLHICRAYM